MGLVAGSARYGRDEVNDEPAAQVACEDLAPVGDLVAVVGEGRARLDRHVRQKDKVEKLRRAARRRASVLCALSQGALSRGRVTFASES